MAVSVRPRPEVADDLAALEDDELRISAIALLVELESRPYLGRPLRGDLGDCRKIYFDHEGVEQPRFRVVYRLRPNETDPTEVDVICIGERAGLDAYRLARDRLGRR